MDSKRKDWIIGITVALITIVLILVVYFNLQQSRRYRYLDLGEGDSRVAVIELQGPIYGSRRIVRQFQMYGEIPGVKAIVFRIDSPGGSVAASQEIYQAVRRVRESGKPVVISMGIVAASGGYYVACGADTIMANPGTTTGSIGVIAEFMNARELLDKVGLQFQIVKSGPYKDSGSPHRPLSRQEREVMQSWVDDAFNQFVHVIMEERELSREEVLSLADGRVYTGKQALELGLVDVLGDYQDAIELAARMGGIQGKPEVIQERRYRLTLFDLLFQQIEGILRGFRGGTLRYALR
jgi:protease-4